MWTLLLVWACAGGPARNNEVAPKDPSPEVPAASPAGPPAAEVRRARMGGHFNDTFETLAPLIDGDPGGARERLSAWPPEGHTPGPDVDLLAGPMRAFQVASDADAPQAYAAILATCGGCHSTVGRGPRWPEPPVLDDREGLSQHMARNQQGVEQLWLGLVGADAEAWRLGIDALRASPPPAVDPAAVPAATQRAANAQIAAAVGAPEAAAAPSAGVLAAVLTGCGACHAARAR